ncbi:serine hydrolase domain-containing protein [Streptomyces sp. NPDC094032]|uniref:serine hydrolase domain-containing protein n=1 Tax=Streptomyces sp. NPDC094032 TaxID=3155308 RepID=UPI00332B48F9
MTAAVEPARWHHLLSASAAKYGVPGASLAFFHDGKMHEFATGVLNRDTQAPVRTDSLFQIGSVTKVWTATQIMLLVEAGRLTLDTPVVEVLPDFRVADATLTKSVTVRHLLSHTSGIDGDLFLDTGRGDDTLEKYAEACRELTAIHPLGATQSYCNSGFSVLGRIIEQLTGKVWDTALRTQIIEPLGLTHTVTLPEEALRHSAAMGHEQDGSVAPVWGLMRSVGPAGLICARASDVVRFGQAHLTDGLLRRPEAMWDAQVTVPCPMPFAAAWGLGWMLDTLSGHRVVSHGGNTIGQSAILWVVPERDFVACVLMNGGDSSGMQHAMATGLFGELLGIEVPAARRPPATPVAVDTARYTGVYESVGSRVTVSAAGSGGLRLRMEAKGALAGVTPVRECDLVAVGEGTMIAQMLDGGPWMPMAFYELADGSPYLHLGARALPKTA